MKPTRKHFMDTLCALLAADEPADPRKAARYHWLHRTAATWDDARQRCDAVWMELVRGIPEDDVRRRHPAAARRKRKWMRCGRSSTT